MTDVLKDVPEHIRKPHIRPMQPVGVKSQDGKQWVALRDPAQLVPETMVVPPQAMPIIQRFQGEHALDQLAEQLNASVDQFLALAKGLDRVGLLWGPTHEQLESQMKATLAAKGAFPVRSSQMLGKTADDCREALDEFFAQTEDPELESPPRAIIAPHLDYQRGWPNYAAAYYPVRSLPKPDRVVILGTNHFGTGDGVVLSELGFSSPMGVCPPDKAVTSGLAAALGKGVVIDQLDHLAEHSIELQLPWIQYCWGNVPVVAALVPDPLSQMITDDGERTATEPFLAALKTELDKAGGSTFFVSSADLSHVGPQFGEPRPVDEQRRFDVERHDREMMAKYLTGDAEDFIGAMKWNKNPTRWCSIGNMAALLALIKPETVELIDYRQAYDDQGMALVSSASMALA